MKILYIQKRLKKYRKQKGLTQEELAEKAGISTITLHRWEKGIRNPSIDGLQKIAKILGIKISDLLDPIPLEEARKEAGYTPKELAEKLGVDPETYLKWENHFEIPPKEIQKKLEEILEENLDFSIYIQNDKTKIPITGNIVKNLKDAGIIEKNKRGGYDVVDSLKGFKTWKEEKQRKVQSNAEFITSNMRKVPVINYHAGAGKPFLITDIDTYVEDYIYLPKGFVPAGKLFAIRVQGDSMIPKFKEGDYAVVNVDGDVLSGNVAVVQIDTEDLLLKQVFWLEGRQKVELRSFNPAYKSLIYNAEDIFFMGKVVGKWENIY